MQFKHPEILYALFLLAIPIIIHLFQLRKFEKVQFTNVKFLKDISIQTRKSSQIKKWLTLLMRLLLLAAIIIAFAQPYITKSDNFNTKNETVVYLDNSFSMQAQSDNGSLLNQAIQELIEYTDEDERITLFTNNTTFKNTTIKAIRNELIQLKHSPNQLSYEAAILKGQNAFSRDESSNKNLVLISDFQQKDGSTDLTMPAGIDTKMVKMSPKALANVSLDTVYVSKSSVENLELTVELDTGSTAEGTIPVSLFNGDNLVAKSSVELSDGKSAVFSIPANVAFDGRLSINDRGLSYDNDLYFNLNETDKIKVLSVNQSDDSFLGKIFTDDEFNYSSTPSGSLNYNNLEQQNLIVLNELSEIPVSLTTALKAFTDDGGAILIIPSEDASVDSYNQLLANYGIPSLAAISQQEKRITTINFSHPLLQNVFDQRISNFQYPKVNSFFPSGANGASPILSFEDNSAFLSANNKAYTFSAALNEENSNFKSSPLIVPVIYNIGKQSLKTPQLYYINGKDNQIDIATQLQQDDILNLVGAESSSIPLQQTFTNKVQLSTGNYPERAGIIEVKNKDLTLKKLSFNDDRSESQLNYLNLDSFNEETIRDSVASALSDIKNDSNVNELWKWFVIFALVFLVAEMLILKFLK